MAQSLSSLRRLDTLAHAVVKGFCSNFPNDKRLIDVYVRGFIALLQDSPIDKKPLKVLVEVLKTMFTHGLLTFIGELAHISDLVLKMHSISGTTDHTEVLTLSKKFPFYREILSYSRSEDPELLRYLLSVLLFGKKLKIDNPLFSQSAFRGWQESEDRLANLVFDKHLLNALGHIVGWLVHPIYFTQRRFRNGPGKVAEHGVNDVYDKAALLRDDVIFSRTLKEVELGITCRISRRKLVPKDVLKGYRTIAMEPASLMFIQQGTMDALLRTFQTSNISRFVDLADQSLNQQAAISGSIDGEIVTLDLSSASDLVHLSLVDQIFPFDLKRELFFSRSVEIDIGDAKPIQLNKFASMGSALCFPVECIIFTAIGLYSALRKSDPDLFEFLCSESYDRGCDQEVLVDNWYHSHYTNGRKKEISSPLIGIHPLRVYGDDICCDRHFVDEYVEDLTRFGFLVNQSKSFMDMTSFRESCGVYAFKGVDVTPLRLLVDNLDLKSPRVVQSYIALANRCLDYGYKTLRRYIYSLLKYDSEGRRLAIPHVEDKTIPFAFHLDYVPVNSNDHLRHRTNKALQRKEFKVFRSKDVKKPGEADSYLYMQKLQHPPKFEENLLKRGNPSRIISDGNLGKDFLAPWRRVSLRARVVHQWISGLP